MRDVQLCVNGFHGCVGASCQGHTATKGKAMELGVSFSLPFSTSDWWRGAGLVLYPRERHAAHGGLRVKA